MAHLLLVGDKEACSINRLLLSIFKPSSARSDLRPKWWQIATHLDTPPAVKGNIEDTMSQRRMGVDLIDSAMETILLQFRSTKSSDATLDKVIKAFYDNELVSIADSIRQEFNIPSISSQTTNPIQPMGGDTESTLPEDGGCLGKSRPPCSPNLWKVDEANLMRIDIVSPVLSMEFDDDHYKLSVNGKRYALIINIVQFKDKPRNGAIYDSYNLTKLLTGLNYKVENQNDYKEEFTKARIHEIIKRFKANCIENKAETFIVFVGSHGEHGNLGLPNGDSVNIYDDIVYKMGSTPADYPEWAKIPKVFIISACRDKPTDSVKPLENAIVCFSCLPNKKSHRDPCEGLIT